MPRRRSGWTWVPSATTRLWRLVHKGALEGDEHTAAETGSQPPGYAGYAVYFFTRRAVEMVEEDTEDWTTTIDPDNPEAYPEAY